MMSLYAHWHVKTHTDIGQQGKGLSAYQPRSLTQSFDSHLYLPMTSLCDCDSECFIWLTLKSPSEVVDQWTHSELFFLGGGEEA